MTNNDLSKNSHLILLLGGHLIARTEIIGALLHESNLGNQNSDPK
jgi:hypothetical protein